MQKRKGEEMPLYYVFKDLEKRRGRKDLLQKKIKTLALNHFKQNAKILSKVFIADQDQESSLKFIIILKNDNYGEVNKVFRFLGDYDCSELSYRYPVDFRIIPESLESSCKNKELVFEN